MFINHEGRAVNIKISLLASAPGRAAAAIRALAASLDARCEAELLEPQPGGIRLVALYYYLPALKDGYRPHPHLYAIDATSDRPPDDYEDMCLQSGADEVIDLDALDGRSLADALTSAITRALA
jgi:hypothetical protein